MKENLPKPVQYGNYLLLDRVNVGGMAEVFRAKSSNLEGIERLVAIKRILPHLARDPDFSNMFIDEARIAINLRHANIAQMYELSRVGESLYIAMEYVHGRDLRALINRMRYLRRDLPIALVVHVIAKVCEGLDYAHSKRDDLTMTPMNIVHRDVSPQNVIVSYEGEVKIIDFGIAKAASKRSHTEAGILKGKFGYMAPEQVAGSDIDQRADVFCTGILMYELLTTDRLFAGSSELSTLRRIRNVEVTPPSILNRAIPDELEEIVLKALAARPEDRYTYASELADDLQRFILSYDADVFSSRNLRDFMLEVFGPDFEEDQKKLEAQIRFIAEDAASKPARPSSSGEQWPHQNGQGQAWRKQTSNDALDQQSQYPDTPSSLVDQRELRGYGTQEELPSSDANAVPAGYQSATPPHSTKSMMPGTPPHGAISPHSPLHEPAFDPSVHHEDEDHVPPTIAVAAPQVRSDMTPAATARPINPATPRHTGPHTGVGPVPHQGRHTGMGYQAAPQPPPPPTQAQPSSNSRAWVWIVLWLLLGGLFLGMVYLLFIVPAPEYKKTPTKRRVMTNVRTPVQPPRRPPQPAPTRDAAVPPIPGQRKAPELRRKAPPAGPAKATKRWLYVRSTPRRALLYVNGKLMGKTPSRFRLDVRTEPYTMRLRKAGFRTTTFKLTLEAGSGAHIINKRLSRVRRRRTRHTPPRRTTPPRQTPPVARTSGAKKYGHLTIKGSPIARIYINGIDTGRYLLYRHRLPAGTYKVHFVTREGDVWNTKVTVKAGKETNHVSTYKKK